MGGGSSWSESPPAISSFSSAPSAAPGTCDPVSTEWHHRRPLPSGRRLIPQLPPLLMQPS